LLLVTPLPMSGNTELPPQLLFLLRILKVFWAVVLVVGPVAGYIPQYKDIRRTRHYQGFSSVVSFILLTSNILRILSWYNTGA
jgi:hypothetical protein